MAIRCPNLKGLTLRGTQVTGKCFASLKKFNSLSELYLSRIAPIHSQNLKGLHALTKFSLILSKIVDADLSLLISNATNLTALDLSGCSQLNGSFLIGSHWNLQHLHLQYVKIADPVLARVLPKFNDLQSLDLR